MMELTFECLKEKEVIVACSGKKLGYPKDFIIRCDCGQIESLILCRRGGFFHRGDLRVPWCDVERIGDDVIWVRREPACL